MKRIPLQQRNLALYVLMVGVLAIMLYVGALPARAEEVASGVSQSAVFEDVPETHWAYSVIRRAVALGLFSGYSGERAGRFGPEDGVTRAQAVTVLWRMAGKPVVGEGGSTFSDVIPDAYYADAVNWASARRVVSGYSGERAGQFGPGDPVTREQLACMLANYAHRVAGLDASGNAAAYSAMSDAASVSSWAESAMGWCYACGLLSGASGRALPQSGATRAQAAKMLVALSDRASAPWQLSAAASAGAVRRGTTVSWWPVVSGDSSGLSYTYSMALGAWSSAVKSDTRPLSKTGSYQLTVRARDAWGRSQAASCVVHSYELRAFSVSYLGGTSWGLTADVGVGDGRVPGVEYRFSWRRGGSSGVLRSWSADPTYKLDASSIGGAGALELTTEARDASGLLGTKKHTLSEKDLRYPKKWVLLGDSLTEKTFSARTAYYDYVARDIGCTVVNYGESGTGYKEPCYDEPFYQRVYRMDLSDADCLTVFGSFNDLEKGYVLGTASDTTSATIGGCMNLTMQRLKAANQELKIGVVTPTPWRTNYTSERYTWPYNINREECDAYVALLKEVASRHGLPVLDLYEEFPVDPNDPEVRRRYYTEDGILDDGGVHPNSEGHRLMYPLWREFVLQLMG